MTQRQLVIAAMRAPVTLTQTQGEWQSQPSPGGLATALRGVAEHQDFQWIGWPGTEVDPAEHKSVTEALAEQHTIPVFLDAHEIHSFYEEFSNRSLWPLFHGFHQYSNYDRQAWKVYQVVNQRFADAIAEHAPQGAMVWVHDYQLALVCDMVRQRRPDLALGFFLHIPFPSQEIYRTLPVRDQILKGILGADLIGFHTYSYVSHFREACLRVLGIESTPTWITLPVRQIRLSVRPIGISPADIERLASAPGGVKKYEELRAQYSGKKVVIGVDRLDYTKGISLRLRAFEEFLELHPARRADTVFIQVASPSRTGVEEYQSLKREIDELVGRINGRFGTMEHTPIVYINQHIEQEYLMSLYRLADVALVTPLRDGMNLVCLEYIAARDRPGALILSEFTGSATSLPGATLVNPYNTSQVAETLATVLDSPPDLKSFEHMVDYVHTQTSELWADRFIKHLQAAQTTDANGPRRLELSASLGEVAVKDVVFLLDYDGTLAPLVAVPEAARPSVRALAMLKSLSTLATTYIISGRPADTLQEWVGHLNLGLVGEHGYASRDLGGEWVEAEHLDLQALESMVLPVLKDFVIRTPGSKIERKHASLAWHFRGSDPKLGAWRMRELHAQLNESLRDTPLTVLLGSKVVEIRHRDVTKGRAAERVMTKFAGAKHIVCIGDDQTDEEMFEAVMQSGRPHTVCRVGNRNTQASFFVSGVDEVLTQLESVLG